jgi:hypothetical protein
LRVIAGNAPGMSVRVEPQEVKIEVTVTGDEPE